MFERIYYVYILTNKIKTVLYVGVTSDLEFRVRQHKYKINQGFTSRYNVDKLIYFEEFQYIYDAIDREKQLKHWRRSKKLWLIRMFNPKLDDLSKNFFTLSSRPILSKTKGSGEISPLRSPTATSGRDDRRDTDDRKRIRSSKIKLGKFGETIAANYLQTKGYRVILTNYYTAEGEIDLICQKDKAFIFVEVKTRTNRNFGWPEDGVTDAKLDKIILAAEKYIQENDVTDFWQIDIIGIIVNKKNRLLQISHFKNIIKN